MLMVILVSLGISIIISAMISVGFLFISPQLAGLMFFVSMGIQGIIMHPINRILSIKSAKLDLKKIDKIEELQKLELKQITALECSYCNELNGVHIEVNNENSFVCKKCGNENKVVMQFSTVRTTEPLLTDLNAAKAGVYTKLEDILEDEDEVTNHI